MLDLAGDGEYACQTLLRGLPDAVVFTGPMAMDAALYAEPPRYAGQGRPRVKGRRLRSPKARAEKGTWTKHWIRLYGRDVAILIQTWTCLWYTVTGTREVRVVLTRDPRGRWQDRAYFCTDPQRSTEQILARYAHRWNLEVTFQASKQVLGLEDPRNGWWRRVHGRRGDGTKAGPKPRGARGRKAGERTVPFIFLVYALAAVWFFKHGDVAAAVARQRRAKPWYGLKCEPAYVDMLAALRRSLWAARVSRYPSLRPHRAKILNLVQGLAYAA